MHKMSKVVFFKFVFFTFLQRECVCDLKLSGGYRGYCEVLVQLYYCDGLLHVY